MKISYNYLTLEFTFEEMQAVYFSLANTMASRVKKCPKNEFDYYERHSPELKIMEVIAPFVFQSYSIDRQNLYSMWIKESESVKNES